MPLMEWTDKLSVGIPTIDRQHKRLMALANELYDSMKDGHGKDVLGKTLEALIGYTLTHFNYEEKLFAETGYAYAASHKKEHEELKKQVLEFQMQMKAGVNVTQSMEVMHFLKKWLMNHIMRTDKAYAPHLIAKGIE